LVRYARRSCSGAVRVRVRVWVRVRVRGWIRVRVDGRAQALPPRPTHHPRLSSYHPVTK
jgi:hypothetical protein